VVKVTNVHTCSNSDLFLLLYIHVELRITAERGGALGGVEHWEGGALGWLFPSYKVCVCFMCVSVCVCVCVCSLVPRPSTPPVFDCFQFILEVIKNWRRRRPGNEASVYTLVWWCACGVYVW